MQIILFDVKPAHHLPNQYDVNTISQTTLETDSPRNENQHLIKRTKLQSIDIWSNVELKTLDPSEHLESRPPTRSPKDDEIYENNVLAIAKSMSNDSLLDIG